MPVLRFGPFARRRAEWVTEAGVAIVWGAVFLGSTGVAYAAKDVVITTTGEKLEGEIQRVEKDVLVFSGPTIPTADFKIKWEHGRHQSKAIGSSWWRRSTASE